MTLNDVLKYISYRPKSVDGDDKNGNCIAKFRKFKNMLPVLEIRENGLRFRIESIAEESSKNGGKTDKTIIETELSDEKSVITSARAVTTTLHDLYSGDFSK